MEKSKLSRVQVLALAAALVLNVSLVVGVERLSEHSLSAAISAAAPAPAVQRVADAAQPGG